MTAPINLEPVLDFFSGDPFDAATARILRRLTIDPGTLRLLRRAASRGEARANATYAWALGALTGSQAINSPVAVADIAAQAADLAPDEPSAQVLLGLAHAGSFGGRRATPLTARRAFSLASRLDPNNQVPHLLLAAARFGTNDEAGADKAVAGALSAPAYRPYLSPLAEELSAEAPWLSWSLARLWPERTDAAVRFATEALLRTRRRGDVLRLARTAVAKGPRRTSTLLHGLGLAGRALAVLAAATDDPLAGEARTRVAALATRVVEEQRALARRFEDGMGGLVKAAGGAGGAGVATGLLGYVRSRRRWPPPIPLALPGRTIGTAGLVLTAGSAALALVENGLARARRRAIEADLLAAEESAMAEAATAFDEIIAPFC